MCAILTYRRNKNTIPVYFPGTQRCAGEVSRMEKTQEKIKELLRENKIVVETRYSTDKEERVAYRSYYVWIIEKGELVSSCVGGDTLYGDEAADVLSRYGYNADCDSVYEWVHSEFDQYVNKEEYNKAGWFFVDDDTGKYDGTYFLGENR